MPNMERVAQSLQQRIAQMAAQYEGEIAMIKEQYQEEIDRLQEVIKTLSDELEQLRNGAMANETATTADTGAGTNDSN